MITQLVEQRRCKGHARLGFHGSFPVATALLASSVSLCQVCVQCSPVHTSPHQPKPLHFPSSAYSAFFLPATFLCTFFTCSCIDLLLHLPVLHRTAAFTCSQLLSRIRPPLTVPSSPIVVTGGYIQRACGCVNTAVHRSRRPGGHPPSTPPPPPRRRPSCCRWGNGTGLWVGNVLGAVEERGMKQLRPLLLPQLLVAVAAHFLFPRLP
jgi:hypothetical protein